VPIEALRPVSPESFVPPLNLLIDALIDSLLDASPNTVLRTRLTTFVSYLYGHCTELNTKNFATNMRLDHRQFHYDALWGPEMGTVPFINKHRQIRDEIREGKRQAEGESNAGYSPEDADKERPRSEPRTRESDEPTQVEVDSDMKTSDSISPISNS
jgi:hypothetical protein